ncbi:hypothetical protein Cha6605_3512 [Chamaesiphon minutus PCC 6605]|uniref:Uncharacterized protein n=1 Tax=Chamaesiphon minutus (strain ATCC 27169 / PCC 6605) TaxID=1173020 RepID=K9UHB7_CHAP6|nr:hypothetical protein Cha6605_3512 [Chamaesiphon minutus PCC 6605]
MLARLPIDCMKADTPVEEQERIIKELVDRSK